MGQFGVWRYGSGPELVDTPNMVIQWKLAGSLWNGGKYHIFNRPPSRSDYLQSDMSCHLPQSERWGCGIGHPCIPVYIVPGRTGAEVSKHWSDNKKINDLFPNVWDAEQCDMFRLWGAKAKKIEKANGCWDANEVHESMNEWMYGWMKSLVNEWLTESPLHQPTKFSNESMDEIINEPKNALYKQWISESKNREIKKEALKLLMNERTNEWMIEGVREWVNEQVNEWTGEWMNAWMNAWMNEGMNEPTSEWINEWSNEWTAWIREMTWNETKWNDMKWHE